MKKNILQKATVKDLDLFVSLEENAFLSGLYVGVRDKVKAEKCFENSIIYFIKYNEIIVGSIRYRIVNECTAHISGFVIHSDFQGNGYAREAMAMLLDELKDFKRIDLYTRIENNRAIRLYLSFGFCIESIHHNIYGDGKKRLVMFLGETIVKVSFYEKVISFLKRYKYLK